MICRNIDMILFIGDTYSDNSILRMRRNLKLLVHVNSIIYHMISGKQNKGKMDSFSSRVSNMYNFIGKKTISMSKNLQKLSTFYYSIFRTEMDTLFIHLKVLTC